MPATAEANICRACGIRMGAGFLAHPEPTGNVALCSMCAEDLFKTGWIYLEDNHQAHFLVLHQGRARMHRVSATWRDEFFQACGLGYNRKAKRMLEALAGGRR